MNQTPYEPLTPEETSQGKINVSDLRISQQADAERTQSEVLEEMLPELSYNSSLDASPINKCGMMVRGISVTRLNLVILILSQFMSLESFFGFVGRFSSTFIEDNLN